MHRFTKETGAKRSFLTLEFKYFDDNSSPFFFQRLLSATAENSSEAFPQVTNPGEDSIFSQFTAENILIVMKIIVKTFPIF